MTAITKKFLYGEDEVVIETGVVARQATSAVTVRMDKVMVLVTLVADKNPSENSFFPLGVHYIEKTYATGKIPGGFFKRETRPSEKEVLTSRLIDRPLRPLFPKEFRNEVQIICTVMSSDKDRDPDIAAMLGASACMAMSGLPASAVLGGARVGYDGTDYFLNPSYSKLKASKLDMVVAGTKDAVLMVESDAQMLSEDVMLGGIDFAHKNMQVAIDAITELADEVGTEKWEWEPPQTGEEEIKDKLVADFTSRIEAAYDIHDKQERRSKLDEIREEAMEKYADPEDPKTAEVIGIVLGKIASEYIRGKVLSGGSRIDGRDSKTVRPIDIKVGLLPSAHGSVLFTRGETQAIVTTTLGSKKSAQIIDALEGEFKENFMLHYNFPPFCVGEISFLGSPKRREIGHGRLAKRAVSAVLPAEDELFPYAIRVVSEITESNGSSSMASVCGASLALMDSGVPVKDAVAGIAMGLVLEGDKHTILTDIMGDEDHLGDMDFKVAGTANGVTALQMDIKITGVTIAIMKEALAQAHEARQHILGIMNEALPKARDEISPRAPYMETMVIDQDKVREVIGKKGAVIRAIIEKTGAEIDIEDNVVSIYGEGRDSAMAAKKEIEDIIAVPEEGNIYEGKVSRIADFGAFVDIIGNNTGLVHISQISNERVNKVEDYLKIGQSVNVKVLELGDRGRIRLSIKEASQI